MISKFSLKVAEDRRDMKNKFKMRTAFLLLGVTAYKRIWALLTNKLGADDKVVNRWRASFENEGSDGVGGSYLLKRVETILVAIHPGRRGSESAFMNGDQVLLGIDRFQRKRNAPTYRSQRGRLNWAWKIMISVEPLQHWQGRA